MNRRDALLEAHGVAAAVIRQYVRDADDWIGDDKEEDEKIRTALGELADRHDAAAHRMSNPPSPGVDRG